MNSGGEGEGLAPLPVLVGPIPLNASLAFPGLGRFAGAFVGEGNELHVFAGAAGFTNGNFAGLLRVGSGFGSGFSRWVGGFGGGFGPSSSLVSEGGVSGGIGEREGGGLGELGNDDANVQEDLIQVILKDIDADLPSLN